MLSKVLYVNLYINFNEYIGINLSSMYSYICKDKSRTMSKIESGLQLIRYTLHCYIKNTDTH